MVNFFSLGSVSPITNLTLRPYLEAIKEFAIFNSSFSYLSFFSLSARMLPCAPMFSPIYMTCVFCHCLNALALFFSEGYSIPIRSKKKFYVVAPTDGDYSFFVGVIQVGRAVFRTKVTKS
jgi:hypothetical protein